VIVLVHPTGNANVRAGLDALDEANLLERFATTIAFSRRSHPLLSERIRGRLRRNYSLPDEKIDIHPLRESVRLMAGAVGLSGLTTHETGWASLDQVFRSLDREVARRLRRHCYGESVRGVYAYEDCALEIFEAARSLNLRRIYDLPIAYWMTARKLLQEEAERYPDWEPTLGGTRDSQEKLDRKTRELELADLVICPSRFVFESIPEEVRAAKKCLSIPFGSPVVADDGEPSAESKGKFRVLFAGAMTQRKGLADVFAAMKLLASAEVELVVMGSLVQPLEWYERRCRGFKYEAPRPHDEFLQLMKTCHVLVLPSIVEGRALVQQEAMACGIPVIATSNAGADDVIEDGRTGFLVPIRSPEEIAKKIGWMLAHREEATGMGIAAQARARELTWRSYGQAVMHAVRQVTNE
jgi:glycosyltransferase involved in cell wall biosynthesis